MCLLNKLPVAKQRVDRKPRYHLLTYGDRSEVAPAIRGTPFKDNDHWKKVVLEYADGIVPACAWGQKFDINGAPMIAIIYSMRIDLPDKC